MIVPQQSQASLLFRDQAMVSIRVGTLECATPVVDMRVQAVLLHVLCKGAGEVGLARPFSQSEVSNPQAVLHPQVCDMKVSHLT